MHKRDKIYIQTVCNMDDVFYEPLVGVIKTQIHHFVAKQVNDQVWGQIYTQISRQVKFVIEDQIENE